MECGVNAGKTQMATSRHQLFPEHSEPPTSGVTAVLLVISTANTDATCGDLYFPKARQANGPVVVTLIVCLGCGRSLCGDLRWHNVLDPFN